MLSAFLDTLFPTFATVATAVALTLAAAFTRRTD
jgi:hypothetical protein